MIDLDELRFELHELVPLDARRNWTEVVTRSGLARERRRRRWGASVGALVAVALLVAATPLGAGIARGLEDFSSWLTGEPGTRASEQEQRDFDRLEIANAFRCGHGRTGEHTLGPQLPAQTFRKHRCELIQFVDVLGIAHNRERELTRLLKIVIVDFQALHR